MLARVAACVPGGAGQARGRGRRLAGLTPAGAVITAATLLAFGLRLYYQYTRPGFLLGVTEYDDGPYFGSAVRLVHGVLPYKGFIFVQPPGITLLMSPVAAVSNLTGTAYGMAIGRLLTVAAGTAAVTLAGLLVRHRGLFAVIVTCAIMASYPDAVAASHTVLVEPWLVVCCLAGALAVFDGDRLSASRGRLAAGGALFGFAGAVEAWAIVPVLVIAALSLAAPGTGRAAPGADPAAAGSQAAGSRPGPRRAGTFAAGVVAGFGIPALPFAILAPRQFYQSLIVAQVGYRAHAYRVGLWFRLRNMVGIPGADSWGRPLVLVVAAALVTAVAGAQLAAWRITGRRPAALDWFATVTAGLVAAMFLWPPQFHYHFSAFLAPFLALALALPLSRLVNAANQRAAGQRRPGSAVTGLAAAALVVMAVFQATTERVLSSPVIGPVPAAIPARIPAGACVLADQVSITLAANRFTSTVPGCPQMVDSLGTDLALSGGRKPATGAARVPAVTAAWREAFGHAQYLLLTHINARRIAWTPALRAYVAANFVQVYQAPDRLTLYVRKGLAKR
jgi:hypothetical protein